MDNILGKFITSVRQFTKDAGQEPDLILADSKLLNALLEDDRTAPYLLGHFTHDSICAHYLVFAGMPIINIGDKYNVGIQPLTLSMLGDIVMRSHDKHESFLRVYNTPAQYVEDGTTAFISNIPYNITIPTTVVDHLKGMSQDNLISPKIIQTYKDEYRKMSSLQDRCNYIR